MSKINERNKRWNQVDALVAAKKSEVTSIRNEGSEPLSRTAYMHM